MSTAKPWDAIRVKPPVTPQPIGVGEFYTGRRAKVTVSSPDRLDNNSFHIRFSNTLGDGANFSAPCCREMAEFFTALAVQLEARHSY